MLICRKATIGCLKQSKNVSEVHCIILTYLRWRQFWEYYNNNKRKVFCCLFVCLLVSSLLCLLACLLWFSKMLGAGGSLLTWPFMSIARPLEFFPLFLCMLICLILLNAPKALLFQSWQSAAMAFIVCCPNAHPLTPPLHFLPLLSNKNHHLPSFKLRPRMYKDDTPEDDPIWIKKDTPIWS